VLHVHANVRGECAFAAIAFQGAVFNIIPDFSLHQYTLVSAVTITQGVARSLQHTKAGWRVDLRTWFGYKGTIIVL
jgi:hypothetical protein